MKRTFTFFFFTFSLGVGAQSVQLTASEFLQRASNQGVIVIDIRTEPEFNTGHLENAINIDFLKPDFVMNVRRFDLNKEILIYCASGNRSSRAITQLKNAGFIHLLELSGGISTLKRTGYHSE